MNEMNATHVRMGARSLIANDVQLQLCHLKAFHDSCVSEIKSSSNCRNQTIYVIAVKKNENIRFSMLSKHIFGQHISLLEKHVH